MKITNAWIDDPTLDGELELPRLAVEVDAQPGVTIQPEPFAGGWTVGKYGPFVQYRCNSETVSAGDFNVRFRTRFPVVVDIDLYIGEDADFPVQGFSLPLTRARQLVRKHDPNWRLLVSDRAAIAGTFMWVPVETNPACRHWLGTTTCKARPSSSVGVRNVNLPLCEVHLQAHNAKQANKRTVRAS